MKEVRLSREPVSLNSIVDDIIMVMESDTEDRGIRIVRDYTQGVEVFVDPNRVQGGDHEYYIERDPVPFGAGKSA